MSALALFWSITVCVMHITGYSMIEFHGMYVSSKVIDIYSTPSLTTVNCIPNLRLEVKRLFFFNFSPHYYNIRYLFSDVLK